MDNNQKRFVEDALDLLNELDEGLMQLEANPEARAPLEQVFRTMHTIKGGANMFGFPNIGELAHNLETLFDFIRQGKLQISDKLISITLHAFDKVRDLFQAKDASKILESPDITEHITIVKAFVESVIAQSPEQTEFSGTRKDVLASFFIRVAPTVSLTVDGNHALVFIIKDVEALGTSKSYCYNNNDGTVAHWDIFLSTTSTLAEIESYFLFIEDECKVITEKLYGADLFESPSFTAFIDHFTKAPVEVEVLRSFVAGLSGELDQDAEEESELNGNFAASKKTLNDTYVKVSKRKIDDLLNWISELIILQAQLTNAASGINSQALLEVTEHMEMVTHRLRDTSLEIGLVPVETLVTKFKRLVRDLSKGLNKKVNFLSEGAETELDKDVIEVMSEPIMHIIRNAIDHGIETPEIRRSLGKSEHGTIKLKAFNSSSFVNLVISDDGKGIRRETVLKKAIEKGMVSPEAQLADDEILSLIFHSGLSTATAISDVSGRGVGMDVVKQKIDDLRGYVSVKSTVDKGTSIHIKLPLSRSIIEGLLVRVDDTRYVVPLNMIERIDRIPYDGLDKNNSVNKSILVNEQLLNVFSLRNKFHPGSQPPKTTDIISISVNGVRRAIAVDRIEGKMQTVLKPLGAAYQQQDFIAGSTILGDGSLALVLDPSRLFQSFQ
jgi:two-component system chemotaxis sensor kinase CheA